VIDAFEARYPECRVEVVELAFRERYEPLRTGDVDLMVTRLPLNDRAIVTGPVISNEPPSSTARTQGMSTGQSCCHGPEVSKRC